MFLERVGAILAEQRGWNAKSQSLLAAAAREFGLNDAEAREALETLHQPVDVKSSGSTVTSAAEKQSATRWRVEGAPAPCSSATIEDSPRNLLGFLAAVAGGGSGRRCQSELEVAVCLAHGTRVLGLSPVYAQHLLLDCGCRTKNAVGIRLTNRHAGRSPAPSAPSTRG